MRDRRLPFIAVACALTLPLTAMLIHPWVERGLNDDWSYTRSAQLLAQTGHIVYNGWSSASLGWQLALGAIFIKLFGFSFSIVRATTLLVATLTAFLFHRTLVRSGSDEWTSAIGTLTLVLSPLFLPLTFSFMTDVGGLFIIILCLYACLRAITASSSSATFSWLACASLSNAFGGTVRQIAWLGVIVMVPCTLWPLRRRRPRIVLPVIAILCASYMFIFLALRWFARQPFTIAEPLLPGPISFSVIKHLLLSLIRTALEFPFFLLPVLVMFVPALSHVRRTLLFLTIGAFPALLLALALHHRHKLHSALFPYLGNYISAGGLMAATPIQGIRPVMLNNNLRLLVTTFALLAIFSFVVFLFDRWRTSPAVTLSSADTSASSSAISWPDLGLILAPFTLAYLALLMPRGAFVAIFDRYLLPLIAIALLLLLRLYQEQVWPNPHLRRRAVNYGCIVLIFFALAGIGWTHDLFTLVDAERIATLELTNAGVSPSSIDGGFEFNGWTQIQKTGFVSDPRLFSSITAPDPLLPPPACEPLMGYLFPSLTPQYALSFEPALCQGSSNLPPVPYTTWLPRRTNFVYVIREQPKLTTK